MTTYMAADIKLKQYQNKCYLAEISEIMLSTYCDVIRHVFEEKQFREFTKSLDRNTPPPFFTPVILLLILRTSVDIWYLCVEKRFLS